MRNLGIVFSNRLQSFLLGLLGLWVAFFALTSTWQIVSSYVSTGRFDAPISVVLAITIFLFAPYFFVTGYMLRSLAARIAFYRQLRKQIVITEYEPPRVLSPAEAGILADDEFSLRELAATLKDLELRGNISLAWQPDGELGIDLSHKHNLRPIETGFLNNLFQRQTHFSTGHPGGSRHLLSAGHALARDARAELVYGGQISKKPGSVKALRQTFMAFLGLAAIVQLVLTIGIVQAPDQTLNVVDNSYPMHWSEPALQVLVVAATLLFVVSGFWMRKLTDGHGLKSWRYVAGLKLYLAKVYRRRFYRDGRLTVSERELRMFYPYAIVLGVEKDFTRKLERAVLM